MLNVNSSERSITHRLAIHLASCLPEYDVDCEYNRDGLDIKRLSLSGRNVTEDMLEAVTVFPDIVVHKRGNNESNLLVVEMKKVSTTVSNDYDIQKLAAFRSEFGYIYSAHITVGLDRSGAILRSVIWTGG